MYQTFGLARLLAAYAHVVVLIAFLIFIVWSPRELRDAPASDLFTYAGYGVTVTSVLFGFFGQTKVFSWICRIPILRSRMPDIDGHWEGTLESNWPWISARSERPVSEADLKDIPLLKVPVKLHIKARLFRITTSLRTNDGRAESQSLSVQVRWDNEHQRMQLVHVYRNTTLKPDPDDASIHFGASCMNVKRTPNGDIELVGEYWTNRNWNKGRNTAGTVHLTRQ